MNTPTKQKNVVIRFAGDSGDGMQLTGNQFTRTSSLLGNDTATYPDYPAEIRAPAGTRAGVSGFQMQFANNDIFTPGDKADVLVAMNAAALATNLVTLKEGGLIIVNSDKFGKRDLEKAKLETNPLEDGSLSKFHVIPAAISSLTKEAVKECGLKGKQADRCKNFFALGIVYWLYSRPMEHTQEWIKGKFKSPFQEANLAALSSGNAFADCTEAFFTQYDVAAAEDLPKGVYRSITGNAATALGLIAAAHKAKRQLFYGTYPITPATDILHELVKHKNFNVMTFQAEDEIAGICAAIGASFGGSIGATGTSGPGLALKSEALGLAVMAELPLVVVNVQRGGPSTGMPTKVEQSDLMQGLYGRNGESPLPVVAAATPGDSFYCAMKAVEIAIKYMTPVLLLSDAYIANGSIPWLLPNPNDLDDIPTADLPKVDDFLPYKRDPETLARPWATPGMKGYEHRIGGLEKENETGNVSMDAENHQLMCETRAAKVNRIANDYPATEVTGSDSGLLILSWGSTYGASISAVKQANIEGKKVAHLSLRHISPLPNDLQEIISRYDQVLVPEVNLGQLIILLRYKCEGTFVGLNKVQGQPFRIEEIKNKIDELLS